MFCLKIFSLIIEISIVFVSLALILRKKKKYAWGVFATFLIYFFYDTSNFLNLNIPEKVLTVAFFAATLSIFGVMVFLYKNS